MHPKLEKRLTTLLLLSATGLAFSGYLSAVKIFSGVCALGETCPYFLGHPTCWYGFGIYLVMFIPTLIAAFEKMSVRAAVFINLAGSLAGIIFAGHFAANEFVSGAITQGSLGLSTCAYGLIFYIAIFITALRTMKLAKEHRP